MLQISSIMKKTRKGFVSKLYAITIRAKSEETL